MKKRLLWIVPLSTLVVVILIIIVNNALYLNLSPYKVPNFPVGGFEKQVTYAIDPATILTSLDRGETDLFMPISHKSVDSQLPVWNQQDHLRIANALHQFVWKESLEDWDLYDATFWVTQRADKFVGIDNAYLVYFRHKDNGYIVHSISIDLIGAEVQTGESLYQVQGWKGFKLSELTINSVDQILAISAENSGRDACSAEKNECRIRVSLGSYLAAYDFLSIPLYRYEWNWAISYYDKNGDTIFRMTVDPNSGKHKILDTN
jgi:hypothetical protein